MVDTEKLRPLSSFCHVSANGQCRDAIVGYRRFLMGYPRVPRLLSLMTQSVTKASGTVLMGRKMQAHNVLGIFGPILF